ncbi:MAG: CoA-binding protein [Rhodospirillales bacterium]
MDHETYTDESLRDVLTSVRSLAVVGLSPNWNRPSYFVAKYLQGKGYRIMPVNPGAAGQTILGAPCVASLADLAEVPDMVDVFRNSEAAGPIADEAMRIGATVVWMQIGVRNDAAAARAEAAGLRVIMNRCPKIEYSRLFGELGWQGIDTGIITTKRRPVKPARPLM